MINPKWKEEAEENAFQASDKILRDYLAIDRTRLANIRNLLASIRTSLYLIVSAVAVLNVEILNEWNWIAIPLVILSVIILISGLVIFFQIRSKIQSAYGIRKKKRKE